MDALMINEWNIFKRVVEERANRARNLDIHSELMSLIQEIDERKEYDALRMENAGLEEILSFEELE